MSSKAIVLQNSLQISEQPNFVFVGTNMQTIGEAQFGMSVTLTEE